MQAETRSVNKRAGLRLAVLLSLVAASAAMGQAPQAQEDNPARRVPQSAADLGDAPRMIVKFRSSANNRILQAQAAGDPDTGEITELPMNSGGYESNPNGLFRQDDQGGYRKVDPLGYERELDTADPDDGDED